MLLLGKSKILQLDASPSSRQRRVPRFCASLLGHLPPLQTEKPSPRVYPSATSFCLLSERTVKRSGSRKAIVWRSKWSQSLERHRAKSSNTCSVTYVWFNLGQQCLLSKHPHVLICKIRYFLKLYLKKKDTSLVLPSKDKGNDGEDALQVTWERVTQQRQHGWQCVLLFPQLVSGCGPRRSLIYWHHLLFCSHAGHSVYLKQTFCHKRERSISMMFWNWGFRDANPAAFQRL